MMESVDEIGLRARQALEGVVEQLFVKGIPCLVVDSPPGAGKTSIIVTIAALAVAGLGRRVAVVGATWEQCYNIIRRLSAEYPQVTTQALTPRDRLLPSDLPGLPGMLATAYGAGELAAGACLVVTTAAKMMSCLGDISPGEFDLLLVDEAYQLAARQLDPLYHVARQIFIVGDPGQLPPLSRADTGRFEAGQVKVHWAAPRELLRRLPATPVIRLPATRRLPADSASLVQECFYPSLPFGSTARPEDRRLEFGQELGRGRADRVLARLIEVDRPSLIAAVLPGRPPTSGPDLELAEFAAELSARMLELRGEWAGVRRLGPGDIGCIDPRVAEVAAIQAAMRRRAIAAAAQTDTVERWQGLERPVIIAVHPLSGRTRPREFDWSAGRFCVMLTRHQLACIVVTRQNVEEALLRYRSVGERSLLSEDAAWRGWQAHSLAWSQLSAAGRLVMA